jgi:hypothetical protein
MNKKARISTQSEVNKFASGMISRTKGFGKVKAEKFGREARSRVNSFAKKVRL